MLATEPSLQSAITNHDEVPCRVVHQSALGLHLVAHAEQILSIYLMIYYFSIRSIRVSALIHPHNEVVRVVI